jgi:hypothetical protein
MLLVIRDLVNLHAFIFATNMYKIIILFFICATAWSQKIQRQVISTQGATKKVGNGMVIAQSVGQSNAAIGNFRNTNLIMGQGYIQSYAKPKFNTPTKSLVSVIVYPNPVVDNANFKFSTNVGTTALIQLFDSRGRLVFSQQQPIENEEAAVSLAPLSEGVYFTKIETKDAIFSTKILKSK